MLPLSPLCFAAYGQSPEVIDGIAAVVNGDIITYSQVRALVIPREKLLRSQFTGEELVKKVKEAREAALKDLIDRQLIIQAFKKENFQIPDHFVDQRMHEIIRKISAAIGTRLSRPWKRRTTRWANSRRWRSERMIVQAMRSKNVKKKTIISPTKIEEYYRAHREEFTAKEQVKLRMIMIPAHANDGNASAQKAMAEEILSKLAKAAPSSIAWRKFIRKTARAISAAIGAGSSARRWRRRSRKWRLVCPSGRISNIVEFSGNFYILKVEDKKGGVTRSLAEVRDEIEKKLLQQEAQELQGTLDRQPAFQGLHPHVLVFRSQARAFAAPRLLMRARTTAEHDRKHCASASPWAIAPGSDRRSLSCAGIQSGLPLRRITRSSERILTARLGKPSAETARAAAAALEEAVDPGRRGELDAVVTGPVHKARMYEVGFKFPGQTEFFAERCGVKNFAMLLTGGKLTVALVTTHIPLREVPGALKQSGDCPRRLIAPRFSESRSRKSPRIAVAGLNPHAGESGKIGREEIEIIAPAIAELNQSLSLYIPSVLHRASSARHGFPPRRRRRVRCGSLHVSRSGPDPAETARLS